MCCAMLWNWSDRNLLDLIRSAIIKSYFFKNRTHPQDRRPMAVIHRSKFTSCTLFLFLTMTLQVYSMDSKNIAYFQPPIVSDKAPDRPLYGRYDLKKNSTSVGLSPVLSQVPAFNQKGKLLASWNPQNNPSTKITFVIVHGGFGIVPADFAQAIWLRNNFNANVLILDSFWSRGKNENWFARSQYGVNMRMLDAIAAGRWLVKEKGVDPRKLFLIGGSQGGWTVLRTFTNDPWISSQIDKIYAGGISLWPNCKADGSDIRPRLGPYSKKIIVFTGGKDTATPISECNQNVFRNAALWKHYPEATHGWDSENPTTKPVNGKCNEAKNPYRPYLVCRDDQATYDMRNHIKKYVNEVASAK